MQPSVAPDALVVRSDTGVLRTRFRNLVILNGGLLLLSMAMIGLLAMIDIDGVRHLVFVFIVLALSSVFQIGLQCYSWGARLAISEPITIDAWGLELHTAQGTVRLPWEAVPEVRRKMLFKQQILTFVLHPQTVPGQNGVEADPKYWPRFLKSGLMLGSNGLIPGMETILPAIQHYSQGRTRIV